MRQRCISRTQNLAGMRWRVPPYDQVPPELRGLYDEVKYQYGCPNEVSQNSTVYHMRWTAIGNYQNLEPNGAEDEAAGNVKVCTEICKDEMT